jgi:hypothetical protein
MSRLVLQELKSKISLSFHPILIANQYSKHFWPRPEILAKAGVYTKCLLGGVGPLVYPLEKNILGRTILKIFLKGRHTKKFENP